MSLMPLHRTRRIRLLEVAGNAIVGGMEVSVLRLLERLPAERFSVTAICPFEGQFADRLRQLGADVFITAMPPEEAPWSSVQLVSALIRTESIDIVHAHLANAHLLAGLAASFTRTPVIATVHGRQLTQLDFEVQRSAGTHLHLVCRQAHVHALGLGVDPARLHYIPNGVDLEVFAPRPRGVSQLRDELGIPANATLLGFVGRLSAEKGPEVCLRAALTALRQFDDMHLVMVGEGPLRGELSSQVRLLGMERRVHFAGLREDIAAWYGELDVLICSSYSEAMPLVIMEAMASGVPVVATHVGGVADLVQHGSTGWLVAPGDSARIAACLEVLMKDESQRRQMGTAARRHAVAHFSIAKSTDTTVQIFRRLCYRNDTDGQIDGEGAGAQTASS